MHLILHENLEPLRALCEKYHVARLEVFGSAARDDFDPAASDLDFLVEFLPLPPGARFDAFFELLEDLEQLFGRRVDLVVSGAIRNRYFLESINRNRCLLYVCRLRPYRLSEDHLLPQRPDSRL